jgi:elongation factor P
MLSTNQFRNGNHIEVDGTIFKIVEFQHVKPGKGGAFVRTKLRRAADGAVIDRTFRAGEKFRSVRTEVRRMQYLYRDGSDAHFMDTESYEQLTIPESTLADALRWMRDSEEVELLYIDDRPADVQLPSAIDLEVSETEPGLRGDTASIRQHRRCGACRHPVGRVRLACLTPAERDPPRCVAASSAGPRSGRFTRAICWTAPWRRHSRVTCPRSRARWPTRCASASRSSTS